MFSTFRQKHLSALLETEESHGASPLTRAKEHFCVWVLEVHRPHAARGQRLCDLEVSPGSDFLEC